MSNRALLIETTKKQLNSYSLNKSFTPLPESISDKIKPPVSLGTELTDNSHLFKVEEVPYEEQARRYMDEYRKAERIVINNFYTGGGAYRKGVLDSIYRGFNPMNP